MRKTGLSCSVTTAPHRVPTYLPGGKWCGHGHRPNTSGNGAQYHCAGGCIVLQRHREVRRQPSRQTWLRTHSTAQCLAINVENISNPRQSRNTGKVPDQQSPSQAPCVAVPLLGAHSQCSYLTRAAHSIRQHLHTDTTTCHIEAPTHRVRWCCQWHHSNPHSKGSRTSRHLLSTPAYTRDGRRWGCWT